jgi:opacity protein-like surface antigen
MTEARRTRSFAGLLTLLAMLMIGGQALGQAVPTATGAGPYVSVGAMGSYYDVNYGQRHVGGVALYADANVTWRLGVEAQVQSLRFGEEFGKRTDTYLIGPKWQWERRRLRPYAKVLVGVGRYRFPYGYGNDTSFVVAPGAGVDYKLSERLTVRLIDVQYQDWPEFAFGSMHPYGVNAGISVALWTPRWRPHGLTK